MESNPSEEKIPYLVITETGLIDDHQTSIKPTSSPRRDPNFPVYRVFPKLAETKSSISQNYLKTEGWVWIRKQEKKKDWKKRFIQISVRGIEYANDLKKKFKGVILFNTIKEVLCSPGIEPHLYQIHIICSDTIWQLSVEKDKESLDAWYTTFQNFIDSKCFNIPRLMSIDLEDPSPRKLTDIQKTMNLRKEFTLDGHENSLFDFKCTLTMLKDTVTGIIYITENYICFSPKNSSNNFKKLKIPFNDITVLNFDLHHQHSDILLNTKFDKYQLLFKNKYIDQIIIMFYLWYHTPTYFTQDDIKKAIAVYKEERKKKRRIKSKYKGTEK